MTTEEIYYLAQDGVAESVILGWFINNIPSNENWREERCYYLSHDDIEMRFFYCVKENGKIYRNEFTITPSAIRKINGKDVEKTFIPFDPQWNNRILIMEDIISGWKRYCKVYYEHRFSSNFHYWKEIVYEMMDTQDIDVVRQRFTYIRNKSWDKIIKDLRLLFHTAYRYNSDMYDNNKRSEYRKDKEMFGYLYNIFSQKVSKSS